MKLSEIQVGKTYTDGKGNERFVEGFFVSEDGTRKGVTYEALISDPYYADCLLSTFARWAKSEVKP